MCPWLMMYTTMYNDIMAQMIRKQVYLEPRQDRVLKRQSRRRGVTEAEIIREALDRAAGGGPSPRVHGGHDPEAPRRAVAFMRALAKRSTKRPRGRL